MMGKVWKILRLEIRKKCVKNRVKRKCGQDINVKNFIENECRDNVVDSVVGWREKQ